MQHVGFIETYKSYFWLLTGLMLGVSFLPPSVDFSYCGLGDGLTVTGL